VISHIPPFQRKEPKKPINAEKSRKDPEKSGKSRLQKRENNKKALNVMKKTQREML
jgi:hypothetical protein